MKFIVAAVAVGFGATLGMLSEDDERTIICAPGYSSQFRLEGGAYHELAREAFAKAGLPLSYHCHRYDTREDCGIVDHICPLELGCSNEQGNIQIQSRAEAKAKDVEENKARRDYCSGKITLPEARGQFRRTRL